MIKLSLFVIITIALLVVFKCKFDSFKKLYYEVFQPKDWNHVEIVQENSLFEDVYEKVPWEFVIHLITTILTLAITSMVTYMAKTCQNLYGELKNRQNEVENKVQTLEEKINSLEQKCSDVTTRLFCSEDSEENELPINRDTAQQSDTQINDNSTQTSQPTNTNLEIPEFITSEKELESVFLECSTDNITDNDSLSFETQLQNQGLTLTEKENSIKEWIVSSVTDNPVVFNSKICPVEIDVVPCTSSDLSLDTETRLKNHDVLLNKEVEDSKKDLTVPGDLGKTIICEDNICPSDDGKNHYDCEGLYDSLNICKRQPSVTGSVDPACAIPHSKEHCEIPQRKIKLTSGIPQYQRSHCSDQFLNEQCNKNEIKVGMYQNKATEVTTTEVSKPQQIPSPRKYTSLSADLVQNPTTCNRRRKKH